MVEIRFAKKVPLREVWKHEQYDFSTWLASNIEFLNDSLPFELDASSLRSEAAAGAFSVDIVGEAGGGESGEMVKIIIENQLEASNHDHLGKLLTYLAAYEAAAAIWITAGARPEHVKAIQWLNDNAEADFYLFDLDAFRIDDSPNAPVAPMLTRIVAPSDLSRRAKNDRRIDADLGARRKAFWQGVIERGQQVMGTAHPATSNPRTASNTWTSVGGGVLATGYQYWVNAHSTWVCLRFAGPTAEAARWYYDHLLEHRGAIEAEFGGELQWMELQGNKACLVRHDATTTHGLDDEDHWETTAEKMVDAMKRLYTATRDRVRALPKPPKDLLAEDADATVAAPEEIAGVPDVAVDGLPGQVS